MYKDNETMCACLHVCIQIELGWHVKMWHATVQVSKHMHIPTQCICSYVVFKPLGSSVPSVFLAQHCS